MKLAIFDVEAWERDTFGALDGNHDLAFTEQPLTAETAREHSDVEGVSVFINSEVGPDVLEALPGLKVIATRSTGVNHIDMAACEERGITVCNVPNYGKNTVAEHAFGLLLTISRRLEEAIDRTRKGDFSLRGLQGFDLDGKTIGVIGTGDIGTAAIRIAKGFGMRVLAYDMAQDKEKARAMGFAYTDLGTLLESADVVTLHVPATPKTRHLIGEPQFAKMKPGVVLINTSRGDIVDIKALARALAEGKVSGAGLDVLPNEPVIREEAELLRSVYEQHHDLATLLADEILVRMRNVVVTPHSAFNTREAVQRILDTTVENIRAFEAGSPINAVAAPQGGD